MKYHALFILFVLSQWSTQSYADQRYQSIAPLHLRCEYLVNPLNIDATMPRLSWRVESDERGQKQTAYHILVASSEEKLNKNEADLWDTGKCVSDKTLFIEYAGSPLSSRQECWWKVGVWGADGEDPVWSETAAWTMGLLSESDWSANYISYKDESPVFSQTSSLYLPAARQYRKEFTTTKQVTRATVYATSLGIYELHLNGQRVGDAYFTPGWTDYEKRAYYNAFDVTDLVKQGDNAIGAWVADGWYSGYVGFGLLTGMGTEKTGRATYGKTPSLMAQLEIQYSDGSRETVCSDTSWKVTGKGPIQEADLLMGEAYDATRQMAGWASPGFDDSDWEYSVLAKSNKNITATFYQRRNPTKPGQGVQNLGEAKNLGFNRPHLEAFPGVPVRITEMIPAKKVTQRKPGTYVFDLGQNFAGVIRLKLKGAKGHKITIRYGEMLHPDGRLMTENLRKARATDFYTCSGDPQGETFQPRFTFHGFQFVEVENFPGKPSLDTVTGLVMHSDTPMTSTFECSDPMVNQLYKNIVWTQRANFLDLPTDCPQRDERMGWTGDAQAYVATAAYNADIGAFYTKWLRELMESQRPSGAFPGYAPFPFQHGWDFGTAWADAGVICPWTIWQAYGDTRVIETCWEPMTRFMQWRKETSVNDLGISHGNAWGDWLAQGASTPLDYIDTIYYAISARMMSEMAAAIGKDQDSRQYSEQFQRTGAAFAKKYLNEDGSVNIKTQTAQALALFADLIPRDMHQATGTYLANMIAENGNHMSTGFLGTRPLLPVLSASGQHDLASFLLQSREFPSWGYEIANGATTIWERWDSYTKEDAFGRHNAAMNSFSHYAFGAVCEWMFRTLAGIDSVEPGYKRIRIAPVPPSPGSNAMHDPIDWVRASYDSIRGKVKSEWKLQNDQFLLNVSIPANTTALVHLPTENEASIRESGKPIDTDTHVTVKEKKNGIVVLEVESGDYAFVAECAVKSSDVVLRTSKPIDTSLNPEGVDLAGAQRVLHWSFDKQADLDQWNHKSNAKFELRDGKVYLAATGNDSQIATTFTRPIHGDLVIQLRANPLKGAESQFFWAAPRTGFNGADQSKRQLMETDQVNNYLFSLPKGSVIDKLRFDPFATFDAHANRGEMRIESISLYRMPSKVEPQTNDQSRRKNKSNFPNVLFILSEDQGAHLSLLGTPGLETPHLDALCQSGTYFENAFVAYPVCSASKAAFYTAIHNHTNGILNNTHNFHKPASEVTPAEQNQRLSKTNRIHEPFLTLTEILAANGFYQGVTHKLHVLPNKKFPYDRFMRGAKSEIKGFWDQAVLLNRPWFLMVNIPYSHRPYPNSDKNPIRVDPNQIELPRFLADTSEIRKDWAEYMAGIEKVDGVVGETIEVLKQSGQYDDTIIIYMSDHGPTFQHGKMTLYDLGLRVPLAFSGPGIKKGIRTDTLASELDILPTLIDLLEKQSGEEVVVPGSSNGELLYRIDGISLTRTLSGESNAKGHEYIFSEISNRGPLPNEGIQERSVFDGRWKLIYRENVHKAWRQVNADTRERKPWGNRTYSETLRVKDKFPMQYRILAEMDPQNLGGRVAKLELYDLAIDPDEINNVAADDRYCEHRQRLYRALLGWVESTNDPAVTPPQNTMALFR